MTQCHYSADVDATPNVALKRKLAALEQAYMLQCQEIARLKMPHMPRLSEISDHATAEQASDVPVLSPNENEHSRAGLSPADSFTPNDTTSFGFTAPCVRREETERDAILILQALVSLPDTESTTFLARLRLGEDWCSIARGLRPTEIRHDKATQ